MKMIEKVEEALKRTKDQSWKVMAKAAIEAMREIPEEIIKKANEYTTDGRGAEEAYTSIIDMILEND